MLRTLFIIAFFAPCYMPYATAQSEAFNITGNWNAIGNLGQERYNCAVQIKNPQHNLYELSWTVGNSTNVGLGFEKNRQLLVGYTTQPTADLTVVSYTMSRGGKRMDGQWMMYPNQPLKVGTETLIQQGDQYTVIGTNPDGTVYSKGYFTMRTDTDNIVQAEWVLGNTTIKGIGLLRGDQLIIAYSSTGVAVGVCIYNFDDRYVAPISGIWIQQGNKQIGNESLMR